MHVARWLAVVAVARVPSGGLVAAMAASRLAGAGTRAQGAALGFLAYAGSARALRGWRGHASHLPVLCGSPTPGSWRRWPRSPVSWPDRRPTWALWISAIGCSSSAPPRPCRAQQAGARAGSCHANRVRGRPRGRAEAARGSGAGGLARLPPFDELTATCLDPPLRITEVSDFTRMSSVMCRLGRSMRPGSCILPTPRAPPVAGGQACAGRGARGTWSSSASDH
jgi:hypothetical protein